MAKVVKVDSKTTNTGKEMMNLNVTDNIVQYIVNM